MATYVVVAGEVGLVVVEPGQDWVASQTIPTHANRRR
jgi:hypothetical protein